MTANELAEIIQHLENARYMGASKAATMLRQQQEQIENLKQWERRHLGVIEKQQAEIEALKLSLSGNSAQILSKNDETLPNGKYEPIAWMQVHYKDNKPTKFSLVQTWEDDIPLYTHPIKELTLTDSEINAVWFSYQGDLKDFARAILRKAQE